jgi:hypothetical protein
MLETPLPPSGSTTAIVSLPSRPDPQSILPYVVRCGTGLCLVARPRSNPSDRIALLSSSRADLQYLAGPHQPHMHPVFLPTPAVCGLDPLSHTYNPQSKAEDQWHGYESYYWGSSGGAEDLELAKAHVSRRGAVGSQGVPSRQEPAGH